MLVMVSDKKDLEIHLWRSATVAHSCCFFYCTVDWMAQGNRPLGVSEKTQGCRIDLEEIGFFYNAVSMFMLLKTD